MPQASRPGPVAASPAEMVHGMIESILDNPKMDVHQKLGVLRELCVERISFDSPEQAIEIISVLAEIVTSDPIPEVRVAALEAMERMIGLEQKAEAEQGKPAIDWRTVNVLLRKARKQAEADIVPVASRFGPPSPETAQPQLPSVATVLRSEASVSRAEAALLAVQENAVAAIKQADVPVVPPSSDMLAAGPAPDAPLRPQAIAEEPRPSGTKAAAADEKPEPPIMKFLRSIADADDEEHIRTLANRIITKIETMTALHPQPSSAPKLNEG